MSDGEVIHVAGPDVTYGPTLRQRCAWCGALLFEYDLDLLAVPEGSSGPTLPPLGYFVAVSGEGGLRMKRIIEPPDYRTPPEGSCMTLDPEVTR